VIRYSCIILLGAICVYALRHGELSIKGMVLITSFSGISAGAWVAYLWKRKKDNHCASTKGKA
jgi:hypothetical protein